MSRIRRICLSGDLFRTELEQKLTDEGMATRNVRWLEHLLRHQLEQATGLPVQTVLVEKGLRGINIGALYRFLGVPFSLFGWAETYHWREAPDTVVDYLRPAFDGSFVIGMEMSPLMLAVLDSLGVTYIDLCQAPIRYLADYFFCMRSNSPNVREKIREYCYGEDEFFVAAQLRKALGYRKIRNREIENDAAMFCGQMPVDSSLISRNGDIASQSDVLDALFSLSLEYRHVYYKRHPHAPKNSSIGEAVEQMRHVEILDMNFYDVMCRPEIIAVAAMSSSTLHEAPFFGKRSIRYLNSDNHFAIRDEQRHEDGHALTLYPIKNSSLLATFWADILSPHVETRSDLVPAFDPFRRPYVRETLNMRWA